MKALITGGSSGLGFEMAKILSSKCDEIIIVAKDEVKLKKSAAKLCTGRAKIKSVALDLGIPDNCKKLFNENKDVDLLINNAGFGDAGYFFITDVDKDIDMINTNITALHILTKLYLREMKKANHGHILNVASIAGFMPGPLMSTYYATKGYVVRLSEAVREELRREKSNVKISILCPGPVNTNFKNRANIKFNFNGISSEYVASYALSHLNHFYIIPRIEIKLAKIVANIVPSSCLAKIMYNIQKERL